MLPVNKNKNNETLIPLTGMFSPLQPADRCNNPENTAIQTLALISIDYAMDRVVHQETSRLLKALKDSLSSSLLDLASLATSARSLSEAKQPRGFLMLPPD
jgi:hypothetical protein